MIYSNCIELNYLWIRNIAFAFCLILLFGCSDYNYDRSYLQSSSLPVNSIHKFDFNKNFVYFLGHQNKYKYHSIDESVAGMRPCISPEKVNDYFIIYDTNNRKIKFNSKIIYPSIDIIDFCVSNYNKTLLIYNNVNKITSNFNDSIMVVIGDSTSKKIPLPNNFYSDSTITRIVSTGFSDSTFKIFLIKYSHDNRSFKLFKINLNSNLKIVDSTSEYSFVSNNRGADCNGITLCKDNSFFIYGNFDIIHDNKTFHNIVKFDKYCKIDSSFVINKIFDNLLISNIVESNNEIVLYSMDVDNYYKIYAHSLFDNGKKYSLEVDSIENKINKFSNINYYPFEKSIPSINYSRNFENLTLLSGKFSHFDNSKCSDNILICDLHNNSTFPSFGYGIRGPVSFVKANNLDTIYVAGNLISYNGEYLKNSLIRLVKKKSLSCYVVFFASSIIILILILFVLSFLRLTYNNR